MFSGTLIQGVTKSIFLVLIGVTMRILYVTTIGSTMVFFKSFIKHLLDAGHIVDIATNEENKVVPPCYREWGCNIYPIKTSRAPMNRGNLTAIKQLRQIVENGKYDIVHCHTPVAAMCTRIACRKARKKGTKVLYTAHGFHFYKGAPLKNWLIYYPVEHVCSYFTDVLITINKEDYAFAKKHLKAKNIKYVPGVGIDLTVFKRTQMTPLEKRKEFEIPEDATVLLSVGELNDNKNHETAIRAIADKDVYYLIVGRGYLCEHLQNVIDDLGLNERVKLLGYRSDVPELCKMSDAFIFPSFREGLSVSLMESMASGLPVACSKIRGNTDLIDENGGVLFDPHSQEQCAHAIQKVLAGSKQCMGNYNIEKIKGYSVENINALMIDIYGLKN